MHRFCQCCKHTEHINEDEASVELFPFDLFLYTDYFDILTFFKYVFIVSLSLVLYIMMSCVRECTLENRNRQL